MIVRFLSLTFKSIIYVTIVSILKTGSMICRLALILLIHLFCFWRDDLNNSFVIQGSFMVHLGDITMYFSGENRYSLSLKTLVSSKSSSTGESRKSFQL